MDVAMTNTSQGKIVSKNAKILRRPMKAFIYSTDTGDHSLERRESNPSIIGITFCL